MLPKTVAGAQGFEWSTGEVWHARREGCLCARADSTPEREEILIAACARRGGER